jgi:4-amino-4-deoxy-L-arabinose transferase-like glycosyltransferase
VVLLSLVLASLPAGRRPVWSSDEARFVLLAQDVRDHGRWLVAELRGREYLNKPQLFFWLVAVASAPFGRVTEVSAAIPGIVAAVASVAGVVALGSRVWGWTTGALAGLILATAPLQFDMAPQVLPDMMLSACLVWALYFFVTGAESGWHRMALVGFYACVTAALLSKGPQALAAVAAAGVAVAFTDGVRTLPRLRPLGGLGAMLVVAIVVWIVPYHFGSSGTFSHDVLGGHYVTWYMLGSLVGRLQSLAVPLGAFMPWTVLLLAAPRWWRDQPDAARRRVALWTATMWVLVALSGNFRSRYVLPVLPGLALLTAELVTAPLTPGAARGMRRAALACAAFTVVAAVVVATPALRPAIAGVLSAEDRTYLPSTALERSAIAACALIGAALLVLGARRNAPRLGAAGFGAALAGVLVVAGVYAPARYTRAFDVRPLAAAAVVGLPADAVVFGHPDLHLSYDVYLRRRVVELPTAERVRAELASDPAARVIMPAAQWERLAPTLDPGWRPLASGTLRGRDMVVVGRGAS